jgi:hypothetical protein
MISAVWSPSFLGPRGFAVGLALALLTASVPAEARGKLGLATPSPQLRGELTQVLEAHGDVVADKALHGKKGPPKSPKQRAPWAQALEQSVGVQLVVVADYKGKKLKLVAYAGGRSLGALSIPNVKGGLDEGQRAQVDAFVAEKLRALAPPSPVSAPPPEPIAPPEPLTPPEPIAPVAVEPKAEPKASRAAGAGEGPGLLASTFGTPRGGMPFAIIRVEFNTVARSYDYNDPVTTNLRPFSVSFMPTPALSLALYPLGLTGSAALSGLGLDVGFATSLGVSSARANGPSYPTTYSRFDVGAHYRLWFGETASSFTLIPRVGFQSAGLSLSAASDGTVENELPNVRYSGLRLGLGFDAPLFAGLRVLADGAFVLLGSSAGDVISSKYFTKGSVNGINVGVSLAYGFTEAFGLEAGFGYQHYFFSFQPNPGDAFIAGGALDQYFTGRLAAVIAL